MIATSIHRVHLVPLAPIFALTVNYRADIVGRRRQTSADPIERERVINADVRTGYRNS